MQTYTINYSLSTPFSNNLNLFIPQTFTVGEKAIISLLNINGKLVLKHTIDLQSSQAVLQTDWILPGVYTLQIKTEKGVQSFNVIKSK